MQQALGESVDRKGEEIGCVKAIANTPSANASVRYVPRGLEIR